jgi:hypothetical protein
MCYRLISSCIIILPPLPSSIHPEPAPDEDDTKKIRKTPSAPLRELSACCGVRT